MTFDVVPLATSCRPAAARLLAARHDAERRQASLLPPLSLAQAQALVDASCARAGAAGWLAVTRDGTPAGFLVGVPSRATAGLAPAVVVPATGHAVVHPDAARVLHAAMASRWNGTRDHHVQVGLHDAARAAVVALGFRPFLTIALARLPIAVTAPPIAIRQATSTDLDTLVALARAQQAHHAAPPIGLPPPLGDERARQQRLLDDLRAGVWIAWDDGDALGMLVLQPPSIAFSPLHLPPDTIHLADAVVVPGARGRGVGAALVAEGLGWVHAIGYRHVALHVHAANAPAWRFWDRLGFRAVAEQRVRRGGVTS